jgi:hypothetical protein
MMHRILPKRQIALEYTDRAEHRAYLRFLQGQAGAGTRPFGTSCCLARGMMAVIVSVPPSVAHQLSLVLVSVARRPPMVVFVLGMFQFGKLSAFHLTRTPPGGSLPTGSPHTLVMRPGLVVTEQGSCWRRVLR